MNLLEIGKRVRKQREQLGYTREQFAELIDITPKFASDIELGAKGMSVSTLIRISRTLKLPTDYILFGAAADIAPTALMLQTCPPDKLPHLENIIIAYLLSHNSKKED